MISDIDMEDFISVAYILELFINMLSMSVNKLSDKQATSVEISVLRVAITTTQHSNQYISHYYHII